LRLFDECLIGLSSDGLCHYLLVKLLLHCLFLGRLAVVHWAVEGQRLPPDQLCILVGLLLDLEDVSHAESVELLVDRYLIHSLLRLVGASQHPPDLDVLIHLWAGCKELLYGDSCAHILCAALLRRLMYVGAPLDLWKFRPYRLLMHLHGGTCRHDGQITGLIVDH